MDKKDFSINDRFYIKDFENGYFTKSDTGDAFRVEIRSKEQNGNYQYFCEIHEPDGKLLTLNGWTLTMATVYVAWYEFTSGLDILDPQGNIMQGLPIVNELTKGLRRKNNGYEIETGLKEVYKTFKFLSQFDNIEDFKTSYRLVRSYLWGDDFDETFKSADDVLQYCIDCLPIKDRLPSKAREFVLKEIVNQSKRFIQTNDAEDK